MKKIFDITSTKDSCEHAKALQSRPTLCDPLDYNLPGSSAHWILQARMLEWVAMPSSRGSSWPRDWTWVFYASWIGRCVLYHQCHLGNPIPEICKLKRGYHLPFVKLGSKKKKNSPSVGRWWCGQSGTPMSYWWRNSWCNLPSGWLDNKKPSSNITIYQQGNS